jgi:hypothetical protein
MYHSQPIASINDCGGIHVCDEHGHNFLVPIGPKTTELLNTLINTFSGQLDRPYYEKSALPEKPIFGIVRLNDLHFSNMRDTHRELFMNILDHYTGLQVIFDTESMGTGMLKDPFPVHIYGHDDGHVWRIHCNDIVTEIYVDAQSIVNETVEAFKWAYCRDE